MEREGLLPYSRSYSGQLLGTEPHPYVERSGQRLKDAATGAY